MSELVFHAVLQFLFVSTREEFNHSYTEYCTFPVIRKSPKRFAILVQYVILGVLCNLDFCRYNRSSIAFKVLHNAIIVQSKTGLNRFQVV